MKLSSRIVKAFLIFPALLLFLASSQVFSQYSVKEFDVDGLKVIYKNTGKDVISARLFITGGTANYTIDKEGIEALAYSVAIKGGTVTVPKSEFLRLAENLGTVFNSDASLDYGEMNMLCLKDAWNDSWKLFADAVMHPAFTEQEFTTRKGQYITYAKQNEADPDGKLYDLTLSTSFKGKNYEKNPYGSPDALAGITLNELKEFYSQNVCKKRAFLVVAGNVDENDVIEKVRSTLANLPEGTAPMLETAAKIEEPAQDIIDRYISTNYICGIMTGIPWDSPDAIAMMVAMDIMYDKYFVELRTKRGLSYAPAAYMNGFAITNPYSAFYITTDHPKDALNVMVDIINDVRKNGFTEEELRDTKDSYLTTYFMRLENASSQALNLGRWNLRGNLKAFENFEQLVNSVSVQDINRVFTGNTGNIKWTYLGDPTKVSPEDFKQIEKIGF